MSSATILFILRELLHDDAVAAGATIAGLAFGPGLTVESALLTKRTTPWPPHPTASDTWQSRGEPGRRDVVLRELMDDPDCDPERLARDAPPVRHRQPPPVSGWGGVYRSQLRPYLASLGRPGARARPRMRRGRRDRPARPARASATDSTWSGSGSTPTRARSRSRARARAVAQSTFRCTDAAALLRGRRAVRRRAVEPRAAPPRPAASCVPSPTSRSRCRGGIVLHSDIERSRLAYGLYAVGVTPFAPGTFLRTDGLRSIRRSYRAAELAAAARRHRGGSSDRVAFRRPRRRTGHAGWLTSSSSVPAPSGPCSPPSSPGAASTSRCSSAGRHRAWARARSACTLRCSPRSRHPASPSACSRRRVRVSRGEARSGGRVLGVVRFDRLSHAVPVRRRAPAGRDRGGARRGAPEPSARCGRHRRATPRVRGGAADRPARRRSRESAAPIVVVAGGWRRARSSTAGGCRRTTYPDRYLMADVVVDATGCRHRDRQPRPGGVLESFPLPGAMRRFVAWDAAADPRSMSRRCGCSGCEPRCGPAARHPPPMPVVTATAFEVRRAVRAAAAPRQAVRDRRHRARGEPDRRAGHEPRPAGCRRPRSPARARGCASGDAPDAELARVGAPAGRVRAARGGSRPSTPARPTPARTAASPAGRSCAGCWRRRRARLRVRVRDGVRRGAVTAPRRIAAGESREIQHAPANLDAMRARLGSSTLSWHRRSRIEPSGDERRARRHQLHAQQQRGEHHEPEERMRPAAAREPARVRRSRSPTTAAKISTPRGRDPTSGTGGRAAPRPRRR